MIKCKTCDNTVKHEGQQCKECFNELLAETEGSYNQAERNICGRDHICTEDEIEY